MVIEQRLLEKAQRMVVQILDWEQIEEVLLTFNGNCISTGTWNSNQALQVRHYVETILSHVNYLHGDSWEYILLEATHPTKGKPPFSLNPPYRHIMITHYKQKVGIVVQDNAVGKLYPGRKYCTHFGVFIEELEKARLYKLDEIAKESEPLKTLPPQDTSIEIAKNMSLNPQQRSVITNYIHFFDAGQSNNIIDSVLIIDAQGLLIQCDPPNTIFESQATSVFEINHAARQIADLINGSPLTETLIFSKRESKSVTTPQRAHVIYPLEEKGALSIYIRNFSKFRIDHLKHSTVLFLTDALTFKEGYRPAYLWKVH